MQDEFQKRARKEREQGLADLLLRPVDGRPRCIICDHPMPNCSTYLCDSCESNG